MLTAPPPNCATGTLAPYMPSGEAPWNRERAQHLFRRLGFGANWATLEDALDQSPTALVDQLIDAAIAAPNLPEPSWSNWTIDDYSDFPAESGQQVIAYAREWISSMLTNGPKERMTLFWHNHFVTRFEDYACPSWMYTYHQLLQTYALGNFRDFLFEIGKTPAMLVFLNGVQNTRFDPNENYARELYELFSLGQDNGYTQGDIEETARALTGWNNFSSLCAPIGFLPLLHDTGVKTIFGQTGNWGYADVHDILFTQRAVEVSEYICGKLYRQFVHPVIQEDIVAGLAETFRNGNWEIAPVLRQLFKSEHFFDENVIGVQIKSPSDMLNSFMLEVQFPQEDSYLDAILFGGYQLDQGLLNPPDVAGWPGDRDWVNSNTLTGRWQIKDLFLYNTFLNSPEVFISLAQEIAGADSTDPYEVTQSIVDFFVPRGLSDPQAYDAATDVFKGQVPQNYFDNGEWNLYWVETVPAQVALLLQHISRLPEFQLT